MPVGTSAIDSNTEELIADLREPGKPVKVAQGGYQGSGMLVLSRAQIELHGNYQRQ